MPATYLRFSEPYAVEVPGLPRLVIMDTAEAGDTETTPELDAFHAEQLASVATLAAPGTWLLTHKPSAGGILDLDGSE